MKNTSARGWSVKSMWYSFHSPDSSFVLGILKPSIGNLWISFPSFSI
ncbi:hypothetical protein [Hoylesella nanceiensis]|nr:hypothetical protein [Hoylesella nanceiensis]